MGRTEKEEVKGAGYIIALWLFDIILAIMTETNRSMTEEHNANSTMLYERCDEARFIE